MGSKNTQLLSGLSTTTLIACCALSVAMSGCDSKTGAPKAPVAREAPVAPITPDTKLAKKFVGKYLNKKFPNDFTELKADGTFVYKDEYSTLTGKYYVEGDRLLLALPNGSGNFSKINDKGITDTNGELWSRKP